MRAHRTLRLETDGTPYNGEAVGELVIQANQPDAKPFRIPFRLPVELIHLDEDMVDGDVISLPESVFRVDVIGDVYVDVNTHSQHDFLPFAEPTNAIDKAIKG